MALVKLSNLLWLVPQVRRDRPPDPAGRHQEERTGPGGDRKQGGRPGENLTVAPVPVAENTLYSTTENTL